MNARKWLNCRLTSLQEKLRAKSHRVSLPVISRLLRKNGYRLHSNVKADEGKCPADRDAQFAYLQKQRQQFLRSGQPIVSVDTKKKELIGNFKNAGQIWCRQGERVNVHDFPSQSEGRAVPYGIYDLTHNRGTVSIGDSAQRNPPKGFS